MGKESESKKPSYSSEELEEIFNKLESQGLIDSEGNYYERLKEDILKRKRKEISELKKELDVLSSQKFKTKSEYLQYLKTLFPEVPLPSGL